MEAGLTDQRDEEALSASSGETFSFSEKLCRVESLWLQAYSSFTPKPFCCHPTLPDTGQMTTIGMDRTPASLSEA